MRKYDTWNVYLFCQIPNNKNITNQARLSLLNDPLWWIRHTPSDATPQVTKWTGNIRGPYGNTM